MSWYTIRLHAGNKSLQGHSATTVNDGVVVIGGKADGQCSSDIHLFQPSTNTWEAIEYNGVFTARHSHIAASLPDTRTIYFYGGQCHGQHFNDFFLFDLDTKELSKLETSGVAPPLGEGMRGVMLGKYFVIFGGCNFTPERVCYNRIYTLHLDTLVWVERPSQGDIPDGRDSHSVFVVGDRMFVFGGRSNQNTLNDLYYCELGKWVWHRVQTKGQGPAPTELATISVINNTAFLIGGCRPDDYHLLADSHSSESISKNKNAIDLQTPVTLEVIDSVNRDLVPPPPLQEPVPAKLGNKSTTKTLYSELETEEETVGPSGGVAFLEVTASDAPVSDPMHATVSAPIRPGTDVRVRLPKHNDLCNDDMYRLDLETMEWSVPHTTGTKPSPRENQATAVVGNRIYLFGGCQQKQCVGDVYMLDTELHCLEDCNNHGLCLQGICHCHAKFSGLACEADLRCAHNCTYRGFCRDAQCVCDAGFAGPDCSIDVRCPANCSSHGVCVSAKCECNAPYHGEACDQATACPKDCSGHGFCSFGYCYCDVGFEGADCSNDTTLVPGSDSADSVSQVDDITATTTQSAPTPSGESAPAFVFVGSNKVCGGSPLFETRNGSLAKCKAMCLKNDQCGHVAWFPNRALCRTFVAGTCDEMWSNPGVQMFQRDPLPQLSEPTAAPQPQLTQRESVKTRTTAPHSTVAAIQTSTQSYGVFAYLGLGVVIGTLLGLVTKSWLRKHSDDEYF
eukprot:c8710_g1_i1.p1 GENE.c8710_g1_i1~~c8710_g1_i1.p1  ORF type:complete len:793 (-),score=158.45 c8710_g1_i1:52-2250(-)